MKYDASKIRSYFKMEWKNLLIVTITGIIYNAGLLGTPWFEGQMAQCLLEVFRGNREFMQMVHLALFYVLVIGVVQFARYKKRLYVRYFCNNVNRTMKQVLYGNLVRIGKHELEQENVGRIMTKAITDADACAEGMRKFTTEIFDTGVALLCYIGMLLWYDWRLALISLIFPPISYIIAEKIKTVVQRTGAEYKESAGRLSGATLDRIASGFTYRVFGCERYVDEKYEEHLQDYEASAVKANFWNLGLPPVYKVLSEISVIFILYFGGKNVAGSGWTTWNIAAFTTFLSCFAKLAVKSSKAAKLFNAVHKAEVSWERIRPLMKTVPESKELLPEAAGCLEAADLGFAYEKEVPVFEHISFHAEPGQIIGVTGPIASGKSSFGKSFLLEMPYRGSIRFRGMELSDMPEAVRRGVVGYLGHDPELFADTICDNVLLGLDLPVMPFLQAVCMDEEVRRMPEQEHTVIGTGGIRLSGGQQQRLALARTLAHKKPVMILDDPFSALDHKTEQEVFAHLRRMAEDSIVILISHRLYTFPEMDQVIWMNHGNAVVSDHRTLMKTCPEYRELYEIQEEEKHEKK